MRRAFSPCEIDTVHTMRAAGYSHRSIAAALGRSKSGVAHHIPGDDTRNRWDAPPADNPDLYTRWQARWQARLPAMREALRDDVKKIVS